MPKKSVPKPEPIIPFTDFERERLIVQLRYELMSDMAEAFRNAGLARNTAMTTDQREMLCAIAKGYELQARISKSTLVLANSIKED